MKKGHMRSVLLGCAAAFSFASVPAYSQDAPSAPATDTPPATLQTGTTFTPPRFASDPQHEFLTRRIVRLSGGVDRASAERVIQQLTTLEELAPGTDVTLIINSPGGSVVQGLAIINRIQSMRSRVNTVCQGEAQSMGAVILAAGTGTRSAYGDCLIMIHQVSNNVGGQLDDLQNSLGMTTRLNQRLVEILSTSTGLSERDLRRAMSTDFRVTPTEAQAMGIIDSVIPAVQPPRRAPARRIPDRALENNFPGGRP